MAVHAEQNALIQCAKYGLSAKDSKIFITHQPCSVCTKLIIQAGITEIFFIESYPDEFAMELLSMSKINVYQYNGINFDIIFEHGQLQYGE
jgi:dCMP deaminase